MQSSQIPDTTEGEFAILPRVRPARGELIGRLVIGPLAALFLLIILVFYVFFSPSTVEGDSMEPTLSDGERMLVTRGYGAPRRGDVVVFHARYKSGQEDDLIKRVVAVPGDRVSVSGGIATVNGLPELNYDYYPDPGDRVVLDETVVPAGQLFVLGDNRPVSLDSRRIGLVPVGGVMGEVRFVWAPWYRIRRVR